MYNIILGTAIVLSVILSILAIVDMVKRKDNNIYIWIAVFILLPAIGALLYFMFFNNQKYNG